MRKISRITTLAAVAVLGSLVLNACGAGKAAPTPTFDQGMFETAVVATFAAELTQTAAAQPTQTPTSTPTFTPTPTGTPTPTRSSGSGALPTASCYGLKGIKDVSIPDNTPMVAGQTFTKTWLVRNTGTCTWEAGFKFSFIGGDAMQGVTLVLDKTVNPGAEVELSVPMIAPNKTGSVRGDWRMSNAAGTPFGDVQFVVIVLGNGTATATPTGTLTVAAPTATLEQTTPEPSLTPTEVVTPSETPAS